MNGIIAGQRTQLADGAVLVGAAPGARIVSLSVGAFITIVNAELAMDWVLENHAAPWGPGESAKACPPIRVINNSWGVMYWGRREAAA